MLGRTLFLLVFITFGLAGSVRAQTNVVEQIQEENAALGAGCNAIAIAATTEPPVAPDQAWLDDHAACTENGVRVLAHCLGALDLEVEARFEVCALIVNHGDESVTMGCENFSMMTELGPFGADPEATNALTSAIVDQFRERSFNEMTDAFIPCTQSPRLSNSLAIFAAFDLPLIEGPVAMKVKVAPDLGGVAAFLVMEPRQALPTS